MSNLFKIYDDSSNTHNIYFWSEIVNDMNTIEN